MIDNKKYHIMFPILALNTYNLQMVVTFLFKVNTSFFNMGDLFFNVPMILDMIKTGTKNIFIQSFQEILLTTAKTKF